MAEKWLEREIASGLQGLLALRLPGAPADDSVTLTLDIWLVAVKHAVTWNESADTTRIRHAFQTLFRTCVHWPAPKQFLDALPQRVPPKALSPPELTPEERARNIARMRELLDSLPKRRRKNKDD
ncbi:MAG: hypothetical protein ACOY5C_04815 [Pseudomonadota bacterium]